MKRKGSIIIWKWEKEGRVHEMGKRGDCDMVRDQLTG